MRHITDDMKIWVPMPLYGYWAATWCVITPLSLFVIFCMSLYYTEPAYWGDYVFPADIQALGWFICICSIILLPVMAIYVVVKGDKVNSYLNFFKPLKINV